MTEGYTKKTMFYDNGVWMQRVERIKDRRVLLEWVEPVPEDDVPALEVTSVEHEQRQRESL